MRDIDDITNGSGERYMLLGFRMVGKGAVADDALIIECDPYIQNDDRYLKYSGQEYIWENEISDVAYVKKFHISQYGNDALDGLVDSLKYYLVNDAFENGSQGQGGHRTWGAGKEL